MACRIALFTCAICLFALGGRAEEPALKGNSQQLVESVELLPPLPTSPEDKNKYEVDGEAMGFHLPTIFGHERKVKQFTWLSGDDPPPPPPQAILTVPSWDNPFADANDRVSGLPEVDLGLPQSEGDFLVRRRWGRMPAFEIVEEPLPPLMLLSRPTVCPAVQTVNQPGFRADTARYETAPAAADKDAAATDSASPTPIAPAFSTLNLPTPSADPVAMVVELLEKLKASEQRGAAARAELARAEQELARLRAVRPQPATPTSEAMVLLEIRFFELDLDGVAKADLESTGVCSQELSQVGLFGVAARGTLDMCPSTSNGKLASKDNTCDHFAELLKKLEEAGLLEYISRPQLMARSGQAAKIQIGERVPLKRRSVTENGVTQNCIEFCTAGVEFDCNPLVLENGNVQIELRAERASVDMRSLAQTGKPAIARQSIETTLELPAGETAVVAGLIFERPAASATKPTAMPYNAQPPRGGVARYATDVAGEGAPPHPDPTATGDDRSGQPKTHERRELVVLVTPKVVRSAARPARTEVRQ